MENFEAVKVEELKVHSDLNFKKLVFYKHFKPVTFKLYNQCHHHYLERIKKDEKYFEKFPDAEFKIFRKLLSGMGVSRYFLKQMMDFLETHKLINISHDWSNHTGIIVTVKYYKLIKRLSPFIKKYNEFQTKKNL